MFVLSECFELHVFYLCDIYQISSDSANFWQNSDKDITTNKTDEVFWRYRVLLCISLTLDKGFAFVLWHLILTALCGPSLVSRRNLRIGLRTSFVT